MLKYKGATAPCHPATDGLVAVNLWSQTALWDHSSGLSCLCDENNDKVTSWKSYIYTHCVQKIGIFGNNNILKTFDNFPPINSFCLTHFNGGINPRSARNKFTGNVLVQNEMKDLLKDILIAGKPGLTKQPIHVLDNPWLQLFFLWTDLTANIHRLTQHSNLRSAISANNTSATWWTQRNQ